MNENLVEVNNSIENNKNGSVKAYQSTIYHRGLDKTIKVRNRDYDLYSQKFDEEIENLNSEWMVVENNNSIKNFIENSTNLHIFAHESGEFNFEQYISKLLQRELNNIPIEPQYENESEPIKPNQESEQYVFKSKWYHKLFGMVESKQKLLDEQFINDMSIYERALAICEKAKVRNENRKQQFHKNVDEYNAKQENINNNCNSLYQNYSNARDNNEVVKYLSNILKERFEYNEFFNDLEFDIDFDTQDQTAVVNFRFPLENEFPSVKEYKYIKSRKEIKESLMKDKDRNDLIKNTYYSLYIAVAIEIYKVDIEGVISSLVLNGFYKGIDKRTGKEFEICIMTSKIDIKEFSNLNFYHINPKDTFKYFSGKGVPDTSNITEVQPIRFSDKSTFKIIDF